MTRQSGGYSRSKGRGEEKCYGQREESSETGRMTGTAGRKVTEGSCTGHQQVSQDHASCARGVAAAEGISGSPLVMCTSIAKCTLWCAHIAWTRQCDGCSWSILRTRGSGKPDLLFLFHFFCLLCLWRRSARRAEDRLRLPFLALSRILQNYYQLSIS